MSQAVASMGVSRETAGLGGGEAIIKLQCPFEQFLLLPVSVFRYWVLEQNPGPQDIVHRLWVGAIAFGSLGFDPDQSITECVSDPAGNFILGGEEVAEPAVETFRNGRC